MDHPIIEALLREDPAVEQEWTFIECPPLAQVEAAVGGKPLASFRSFPCRPQFLKQILLLDARFFGGTAAAALLVDTDVDGWFVGAAIASQHQKMCDMQHDNVWFSYSCDANGALEQFKGNVELGAIALHTFALMHCANIRTTETPLNRATVRRLARHGKDASNVRIKTLTLAPFSGELPRSLSRAAIGYTPLHLVRGHFATYTEDHKLFGKYVGRFWIPAHARGDSDFGQVVKRYKVKGPTDTPAAGVSP